ncbi:MAG: hypothetical protein AAF221_09500 [Pseudomonadota bacterium]
MSKSLSIALMSSVAAMCLIGSSQAATFDSYHFTQNQAVFSDIGSGGNTLKATFDTQSGNVASGTIRFEVLTPQFSLTLADYTSAGNEDGSSGFGLFRLPNGANISGTDVTTPDRTIVTANAANLSVNCANVASGGGAQNCQRIGDNFDSDPNSVFNDTLESGTVLFSSLEAGLYEIAFWEGDNDPNAGTFELTVSAVPVPAAGILFGSALLGAGALRRRSIRKALGMPSAG